MKGETSTPTNILLAGAETPMLTQEERRIRFKPTVTIRLIKRTAREREEDVASAWYTCQELSEIRRKQIQMMKALVHMTREEQTTLENVYGLETIKSKKIRQNRMKKRSLAVLRAQEDPEWDGEQEHSEQALAKTSEKYSAVGVEEARRRGKAVEAEVTRQQTEMSLTSTSNSPKLTSPKRIPRTGQASTSSPESSPKKTVGRNSFLRVKSLSLQLPSQLFALNQQPSAQHQQH